MSQKNVVDATTRIIESQLGVGIMIREFCTIRNSTIGDGCKIYERTSIKKSHINQGSDINEGCYIENAVIGPEVQVAPSCIIMGVTHTFSRAGVLHKDVFEQIQIDAGAWICMGSRIMSGVHIGKSAVIGAGSIVKNDVPAHYKYVGTPIDFRLEKIKD